MRIRMTDGRVLQGTERQIIEAMQCLAFGHENRTLGEYIDWLVDQVQRMQSIAITIEGDTDEEKAASLIGAMLDAGLAERM